MPIDDPQSPAPVADPAPASVEDAPAPNLAPDSEAPAAPDTAAERPDWLPEKFKTPSDLAKAYKELEHGKFSRREDVKKELQAEIEASRREGVPETAEAYTAPTVKTEDKRELTIDPESGLFKWFQASAHSLGLSQNHFDKLVGEYVQQDMARGPQWATEAATLGEHAELRLGRVDGWARANLPQQSYDTFATLPASAGLVQLFEHVMQSSGEPAFTPAADGLGFKSNISRGDVETMMKDPRYWKDGGDKQFVSQVKAAWRKIA